MQNIKIYLITDSVGETAKKIISAVVAQFQLLIYQMFSFILLPMIKLPY